MLLEALKGVAGFLLLMAAWLAVQAYLRKRLAHGAHCDALEEMTHGCGNCHGGGHCAASRQPAPECSGLDPTGKEPS